MPLALSRCASLVPRDHSSRLERAATSDVDVERAPACDSVCALSRVREQRYTAAASRGEGVPPSTEAAIAAEPWRRTQVA